MLFADLEKYHEPNIHYQTLRKCWQTKKNMEHPVLSWHAQKQFNTIDNNNSLTYGIETMSKVLKNFFSNSLESFLFKIS